ncbi:hypothetical protein A2765_00190 [Candidatus Kaiserbacteria bacterium RIFCSPHIGHO2_01_FULL_56_24]|uniref:Uncharacterized protein n=1 Tax=Candidatus Kaiserbacteria bacterium RIFCSPHIGHO2_01_FULL_56_24 TaxID=1798487 RepID=A0A1F6D867_9BACT|nr:MAG: hypothetical protein A2765_00190 [Candidatus Kaiserbacteria bacterium RIFCSPHIGHO2_01_FULL_56_24]
MPCDIGYKSYAKVEIPAPVPQEFSAKSEAPAIDADLLEKLGIEDPEFLDWVMELDTKPLLEEALKRALAKVDAGGLDFTVNAEGMLEAKGGFTSPSQKANLSKASSAVSDRWQFELLGITAELLDYTVNITQKGDEMVLEAEETGKSHPCDYIKVTRRNDAAEISFEHFKSRKELDLETAKFAALADKLGVKLALGEREISEGTPFPTELLDPKAQAHGHGHDHEHEHEH